MLDPGKMRHRITWQVFTGGRDAYGDPPYRDDGAWSGFATVSAAIDPLRGREFFAAEQAQSAVTHKIRCRYIHGVNPDMRILCGTRIFRPVSVLNEEERGAYLTVMAEEVL